MRPRILVVLLLVASALAALWLWPRATAPGPMPTTPPSPPHGVATGASAQLDATPPPADTTQRTAAMTAAVTAASTFVSESEDDGVIADPVRDGMVVLVIDERRQPCADRSIEVRWRKGWGKYGDDRGTTDQLGRFSTTIAEAEMIEGVTVQDPEHGALESWFDYLPSADDARTVLCVIPVMQPVRVRVIDQRGRAVPTASVSCDCDRSELAPREYRLMPENAAHSAAADGQLLLHVPIGRHELQARADGFDALYKLSVAVPEGGCAVTMHMFDRAELHAVAVSVIGPEEYLQQLRVHGFTRDLPALGDADLAAEHREPLQREFEARRLDTSTTGRADFVVSAPPGPWRCTAYAQKWSGSVDVPAFASEATIELQPPPAAPPRARLRCRLLLPDGQATSGDVMVHTAPDLIYGPRHQVSERQPFVEVEPGGKACVSAWLSNFPPALVGPIDLQPGEQEVVLQFTVPSTIAGKVVDAAGQPVAASISLLRPSGPLRALGDGVPEVLSNCPTRDMRGTADDGAFSLGEIGAGRHQLWVVPTSTGWPALADAQPGQQDLIVTLGQGIDHLARIQGRVTLSTTGAPIAGAQLRWSGEPDNHTCYSDADGRFAIAMRPGPVAMTAQARRCAWFAADAAEFAHGLHTRDLVLEPSEPLFVRVRGSDATGGDDTVPDLEITAFDAAGRQFSFLDHNGYDNGDTTDLDEHGRAELGGLPFAPVRLHLQSNDDETLTMDVDVPADTARDRDLQIVWRPGGK